MLRQGNRWAKSDAVTEADEPGNRVLGAQGGGDGGRQVAEAALVGAVPVRNGAEVLSLGSRNFAQLIYDKFFCRDLWLRI